jgi:hypothetical protein
MDWCNERRAEDDWEESNMGIGGHAETLKTYWCKMDWCNERRAEDDWEESNMGIGGHAETLKTYWCKMSLQNKTECKWHHQQTQSHNGS